MASVGLAKACANYTVVYCYLFQNTCIVPPPLHMLMIWCHMFSSWGKSFCYRMYYAIAVRFCLFENCTLDVEMLFLVALCYFTSSGNVVSYFIMKVLCNCL